MCGITYIMHTVQVTPQKDSLSLSLSLTHTHKPDLYYNTRLYVYIHNHTYIVYILPFNRICFTSLTFIWRDPIQTSVTHCRD